MLSESNKKELAALALAQYPKECCAFILKDGSFIPLENIHDKPEGNFLIKNSDYIKYSDQLACVAHSHTDDDCTPSFTDMCVQVSSSIPWVIAGTNGVVCNRFVVFGNTVIKKDWIGVDFIHGVNDCYSLIRNYFYHHHNALLPDFPRSNKWWEKEHKSMYLDHYPEAGFVPAKYENLSDLVIGDLIFMRLGRTNTINHAGVYMGDGIFAHHMCDQLSRKEPIYRYKDKIEKVVRYDKDGEIARRNGERVRRAILL